MGSQPTETRQRIVDAARRCIERTGLAKTTIEDVATDAGVSRQTVYRYFENRDEVLLEALLDDLSRTAGPDPSEQMAAQVRTPLDAVAALVEGVIFTLESIQANPRLSGLLASEGDSVRATLDGASIALFTQYADELRPWLELGQRNGFFNPDLVPDEMSEWLLRITLSLMTTAGPRHRTPEDLRAYLLAYLTPVLVPAVDPTMPRPSPLRTPR